MMDLGIVLPCELLKTVRRMSVISVQPRTRQFALCRSGERLRVKQVAGVSLMGRKYNAGFACTGVIMVKKIKMGVPTN